MSQHILVVDDEAPVRDVLKSFLVQQGYRVSVASSSEETLAILKRTPVDLVVLDIGLAEEDGLTVLAALKAAHPQVRVVMLTGMGFVVEFLKEAQDKGADGYVSKVLPMDELLMAIRRSLNGGDKAAAA
jgi:DNA-binding response OmpR family regulator